MLSQMDVLSFCVTERASSSQETPSPVFFLHLFQKKTSSNKWHKFGFYVTFDTKYVISETFFLANLLAQY